MAVVGHVGAGKSSIIQAMLGEMDKLEGRVDIKVLLYTSAAIKCNWLSIVHLCSGYSMANDVCIMMLHVHYIYDCYE